jgi:hypothetical protein
MAPNKRYGMTTNFFHPCLSLLFLDPGSGMGKNQDPGKHPGSATLVIRTVIDRYLKRRVAERVRRYQNHMLL